MTDKSIEELLAMVEGDKSLPTSKRSTGKNKNVLRFIEECKLENGTQQVPSYVIFYHYRMVWKVAPEDQRYKATKHSFFVTFHQHFVQQRKTKQRYYLLKEGTFELTDELLKKAREYDKNYWGKAKKKAQKEIQVLGQSGNLQDP